MNDLMNELEKAHVLTGTQNGDEFKVFRDFCDSVSHFLEKDDYPSDIVLLQSNWIGPTY